MTAPRTRRGPIYRTMQVAEGVGRGFGVVAGAHVSPRKDKQDVSSHGFGSLGRSLLRTLSARGAPDSAGSVSIAASSWRSCFFDRGTRPSSTAGRQRGAALHCVAIHRRVAPTPSCGVRVDYYPIVRARSRIFGHVTMRRVQQPHSSLPASRHTATVRFTGSVAGKHSRS